MKDTIAIGVLALALLLTGCAGYGTITKNLSEDGAIIKAKIGTPWGVQDIVRIGETSNSVEVGPDGTIRVNPPKSAKK